MPLEERQRLFKKVEKVRDGRALICLLNFDRKSEPTLPGLSTQFAADVKEALFRVLKETKAKKGIDVFLYTRGGDTNSVWPLVSLIREFDEDFEILVPFRCHSSGTLAALGARRVVLAPLSELSPIDPSTGNMFNPRDSSGNRLAISVEDVRAFRHFVFEQLNLGSLENGTGVAAFAPFLSKLTGDVHPLALGNVHRVLSQIQLLAKALLKLHPVEGEDVDRVISALTTQFFSHLHMINRHEAREILGSRIEFAENDLASALDDLLRAYEQDFSLRSMFFLSSFLEGKTKAEVRFIGGVVESHSRSYLFETIGVVRQMTRIPPNVQVQVPVGQGMPLVEGLPRDTEVEVRSQGWVHNTEPKGITK